MRYIIYKGRHYLLHNRTSVALGFYFKVGRYRFHVMPSGKDTFTVSDHQDRFLGDYHWHNLTLQKIEAAA